VSKTVSIKINCSDTVKNILSEALKNYTYLTPQDNNTLTKIEQDKILFDFAYISKNFTADDNTPEFINSYLYSHCHKAINLHYDHVQQKLNASFDEQRKLMLNMLKGAPAHDKHLDSALQKDDII